MCCIPNSASFEPQYESELKIDEIETLHESVVFHEELKRNELGTDNETSNFDDEDDTYRLDGETFDDEDSDPDFQDDNNGNKSQSGN